MEPYQKEHLRLGYKGEAIRCIHCEGHTEEGYVADYTYGRVRQQEWIQGEFEWSFWSGVPADKNRHPIKTYRCLSCGFLQSYAE